MLRLIDGHKALKTLMKYVTTLSSTGYVKQNYVHRLMVYVFLKDMVEYLNPYITEEDYGKMEKALACLFTNGGCLLPYPVFAIGRMGLDVPGAVLGEINLPGTLWHRIENSTGVSVRGTTTDESFLTITDPEPEPEPEPEPTPESEPNVETSEETQTE